MKKRMIIGLSAIALMSTMVLPVSAQANTESKDTPITAKVESEYTLTIPAETDIKFNALSTDLTGTLKVTGNVLKTQEVAVTVETKDFHNDAQDTNLPYKLMDKTEKKEFTTATWDEATLRNSTAKEIALSVDITQADWQSAKAGDYEGNITFTANLQDVKN